MKIAVAVERNRVAQHFGRCDKYLLYETNDQQILEKKEIDHPGHRPGFLPKFLSKKGINLLITGGIGPRAIGLFNDRGIDVISGAGGTPKEVVKKYLAGELEESVSACEKHESPGSSV